MARDRFLFNLDILGIPLSREKTVLATTNIFFLKIGLNSLERTLFIPMEKAKNVLTALLQFLSKRRQRVKEWQSIFGKLCHLSEIVTPGRSYLSSVDGSLKGILTNDQYRFMLTGTEAREDL